VELSACETGLGKISNGDEIVGFTRAFIYGGAPSVITTLWKVNDRASYELMREFYSNLKTMKKSNALTQAQIKAVKEFPNHFSGRPSGCRENHSERRSRSGQNLLSRFFLSTVLFCCGVQRRSDDLKVGCFRKKPTAFSFPSNWLR
jgi:CHAT domain-containing protein